VCVCVCVYEMHKMEEKETNTTEIMTYVRPQGSGRDATRTAVGDAVCECPPATEQRSQN